jgi:ATP-dependent Clp protease ATP-binding subunit ClpA
MYWSWWRRLSLSLRGFTDNAIFALTMAWREARSQGHRWVSAEHLLLGLLDVESARGAKLLTGLLGGHREAFESQIRELLFNVEKSEKGQPDFGTQTKAILNEAKKEARRIGCRWVGTEHLISAFWQCDVPAVQVLAKYGITPERYYVHLHMPQKEKTQKEKA